MHTDEGVFISASQVERETMARYVLLHQISAHAGMKGSYEGRSTTRRPAVLYVTEEHHCL